MDPAILYEDECLLVINKPPGWVVHLGASSNDPTAPPVEYISDWLVKSYPDIMHHSWPDIARVGIVHRLDKDTSGVMLLAKSPEVVTQLQTQFKERTVKKEYVAFTFGIPKEPIGEIETYIGRHPRRRQEQAILPIQQGDAVRRLAISEYRVNQTFTYKSQPVAEIIFFPQTGRMHQLRVHAKFLGTPILGDAVYTIKPAKRLSKELGLSRQMLHAARITLKHPTTSEPLTFTASLPDDMVKLKKNLESRS